MRNILLFIICTLLASCALDVYESNKEILGYSDNKGTKFHVLNPGTVWVPYRFLTSPYRRIIVIDTSKLMRLPNPNESRMQRIDILPVYLDKNEYNKLYKMRRYMTLSRSRLRVYTTSKYYNFFEVGKKIYK